MTTIEFGRFGRPADALRHGRVTFGIPFYLLTLLVNGIVGIVLVEGLSGAELSETAVVDRCIQLLGPVAGVAWLWVTQTRINSANYFVSTINLQAFLKETTGRLIPKVACAIVVGTAALLLTLSTDVFKYLLIALTFQGALIAAWVGLAAAHMLNWTRETSAPAQTVAPRAWSGIAAWLVGASVGGVLILAGGVWASCSAIAAFATAASLYFLLPVRALRPQVSSLRDEPASGDRSR